MELNGIHLNGHAVGSLCVLEELDASTRTLVFRDKP
jgi:hypothetical protein